MNLGQFTLDAFTAPDSQELIEISLGEGYAAITPVQARVLANALLNLAAGKE